MNMKNRTIVIIAKFLLYFILILFISSYFKLSIHDKNYSIILSRIPISILFSLIVVLFELKFSATKR